MQITMESNSIQLSNNRLAWVDALRAIAILLVVWGHQLKGITEFFVFTSPVKLPLFFAISGYVFNSRNGDTKSFFKNWFLKLVIPWICLAMLPQIPRILMGRVGFFEILNILISGEAVWFMPCFVIGEAIHFFIRKYSKGVSWIITASFVCVILGFVAHNHDILNYAMINRALIVQLFFLIGFLFKRHESFFVGLSWQIVFATFCLYLILCGLSLYLYPNECLDVHLNKYYNIPLCFILIFIGIFTLFTIASKTSFSNRVLSEIGKNTLVIYIWHEYAIILLTTVAGFVGLSLGSVWISSIIKTTWAIVFCYCCAIILNKYVPFIVGKKK